MKDIAMGTGIIVRCRECEYEKEFMLGVGELFSSLENVIDLVQRNQRAKVLDVVRNHRVDQREFHQAIFQCPQCHVLSGRLFYRIRYDGNREIQSEYYCPKCNAKMVPIDEAIIKTQPCPFCKKRSLKIAEGEGMLWD